MHSTPQSYEVEWENKEGTEIFTLTVFARSASEAEGKAEKLLKGDARFRRIEHVELYP